MSPAPGGGPAIDWSVLDRPMGPRSVVASLLLGMHPPRLSSARVVRWCALFGISENAARVALSRMVERGELSAVEGSYELTGAVRERQASQDRALGAAPEPWSGEWVMFVVPDESRPAAERAWFRTAARTARLAELRTGVWVRPDNLPPEATAGPWAGLAERAEQWIGVPATPPDCERLFGLDAWHRRAALLMQRLAETAGGAGEAALAGEFVVLAAVLQHLRRDPLLPPALLPDEWAGPALRAAYLDRRPRFGAAAAEFLRAGAVRRR